MFTWKLLKILGFFVPYFSITYGLSSDSECTKNNAKERSHLLNFKVLSESVLDRGKYKNKKRKP